jgi:hypothetical protein
MISDIQRPIEIVTKIGMNAAVKRAVNFIKAFVLGTKSVDAGDEESKRKDKDHEVRLFHYFSDCDSGLFFADCVRYGSRAE